MYFMLIEIEKGSLKSLIFLHQQEIHFFKIFIAHKSKIIYLYLVLRLTVYNQLRMLPESQLLSWPFLCMFRIRIELCNLHNNNLYSFNDVFGYVVKIIIALKGCFAHNIFVCNKSIVG